MKSKSASKATNTSISSSDSHRTRVNKLPPTTLAPQLWACARAATAAHSGRRAVVGSQPLTAQLSKPFIRVVAERK
jgi:hypothetical protein